MKRLNFIIILFLAFSCRPTSDVTSDPQQTSIRWHDGGIDSVKVEPWAVGPLKRQKISMGARIKILFPQLRDSDVEMLANKHKVDSWLVTFNRASMGTKERLGAFYMPLFRSSGKAARAEVGYIDFFYAAASISARLRALECPTLNHRYVLAEAKVRETTTARGLIVLGPMQESIFMGKAERLEFQRNIINGGTTLSGEYQIGLSFYNSNTNKLLSNEVIAPQVLTLANEQVEFVRGCENQKTPPVDEGGDGSIKTFKFGR